MAPAALARGREGTHGTLAILSSGGAKFGICNLVKCPGGVQAVSESRAGCSPRARVRWGKCAELAIPVGRDRQVRRIYKTSPDSEIDFGARASFLRPFELFQGEDDLGGNEVF